AIGRGGDAPGRRAQRDALSGVDAAGVRGPVPDRAGDLPLLVGSGPHPRGRVAGLRGGIIRRPVDAIWAGIGGVGPLGHVIVAVRDLLRVPAVEGAVPAPSLVHARAEVEGWNEEGGNGESRRPAAAAVPRPHTGAALRRRPGTG